MEQKMRKETRNAFYTGIRELRQRITQAEYQARKGEYQDTQDQLTWLFLDVKKLREELRNLQNQEVLGVADTDNQDKD